MTEVYVGMCADILHVGHINILRFAASLGKVTVGLITDQAVAAYKGPVLVPFESRRAVLESVRWVERVVEQDHPSPVDNLRALKPRIFCHGDDWRVGPLTTIRASVLAALEEWGGKLVEAAYTPGVSSSQLRERLKQLHGIPDPALQSINTQGGTRNV